jgi:1-acyl-sn-glycerol-3-phosphate acyltransferase
MRAVQALRTGVFYALFMGQTIVLAIVVGTIAIIAKRRTELSWRIAKYWRNSNIAFLRVIVGVKTEVTGAENIPPGACIIAAKHQSDWDIFAILPFTDDKPAFIAKKELIDIPMFGQAAQSINTISIDRKLGAEAIPRMLEDAAEALGRGCRIVIYPEGTRKKPLADPNYRQGIARMYAALNVPVVPVALNSGLCWGKLSATIWPGTARAKFLPAILPGLSAEAFAATLQAMIEQESDRLIVAAVEAGIARPLSADFLARVAAAKQRLVAGA